MTTFYFVCFLTLFWVQFSHQDEGQGNFTDLYQKLERLEMKVTNQNVIIENQNVLIQQLTTKPPSDTPFNYNIAKNKAINASATCGDGHVDTWCKLAEYNISRINSMYKECNFCTSTDPERYHPANHANDDDESTWWQSPPISRGLEYNQITLEIDLEQEFEVSYIAIKMGNSPRPGVFALEKSPDGGKTWQPWQHFAGNNMECQKYFGLQANEPIIQSDQVTCITEFSQVLPLENGEIYVSISDGRELNGEDFENWTLATNIRLRLIQTKTMLSHLKSIAVGDLNVLRRYYYSIKEIVIGGRKHANEGLPNVYQMFRRIGRMEKIIEEQNEKINLLLN